MLLECRFKNTGDRFVKTTNLQAILSGSRARLAARE